MRRNSYKMKTILCCNNLSNKLMKLKCTAPDSTFQHTRFRCNTYNIAFASVLYGPIIWNGNWQRSFLRVVDRCRSRRIIALVQVVSDRPWNRYHCIRQNNTSHKSPHSFDKCTLKTCNTIITWVAVWHCGSVVRAFNVFGWQT